MSKENYDFPDKDGRFGEFGGKYVSETLISALDELECTYEVHSSCCKAEIRVSGT